MRRMLLISLALLPVMAHAQARTSAELTPSTFAELALPATPAATALSPSIIVTPSVSDLAVVEHIHTSSQTSAPSVKNAAAFGLLSPDLEQQPAVFSVVVDAMVDANGIPHNISIAHSAGKLIDQKAVAAVSQYRFQPTMVNSRPTQSAVSITIKIQKP
jgi:TonB family protein